MSKRMAFGIMTGLTLMLAGKAAEAAPTNCEAAVGELQTGGFLIAGHSNVSGAVSVQVTGLEREGVLQRFDLIFNPIQSEVPRPRYGSFAGMADFRVEVGKTYRVDFVDSRHRTLCVVYTRAAAFFGLVELLGGGRLDDIAIPATESSDVAIPLGEVDEAPRDVLPPRRRGAE